MDRIKNAPTIIFLLVGIVFGAMMYLNDLSIAEGLQNEIGTLESQLNEKTASLKKAQNATQEKAVVKSEIDQLTQTLSMAESVMPKNFSIREILEKISKEAKDSGIRIVSSRPKEAIAKNYYDEIPMEIEFEGSYSQLTFFMYLISKLRVALSSRNIDISTKEIVDGQTSLRLKGELIGYRYKEVR